MILKLNPEQQKVWELATRSGKSTEEVLDRVFQIMREEHEMEEGMPANREEITAQIEEGYAQAMRGELIDGDEVVRVPREDRAQRQKA